MFVAILILKLIVFLYCLEASWKALNHKTSGSTATAMSYVASLGFLVVAAYLVLTAG